MIALKAVIYWKRSWAQLARRLGLELKAVKTVIYWKSS